MATVQADPALAAAISERIAAGAAGAVVTQATWQVASRTVLIAFSGRAQTRPHKPGLQGEHDMALERCRRARQGPGVGPEDHRQLPHPRHSTC